MHPTQLVEINMSWWWWWWRFRFQLTIRMSISENLAEMSTAANYNSMASKKIIFFKSKQIFHILSKSTKSNNEIKEATWKQSANINKYHNAKLVPQILGSWNRILRCAHSICNLHDKNYCPNWGCFENENMLTCKCWAF